MIEQSSAASIYWEVKENANQPSTRSGCSGMLGNMSKTLLYSFAAIADFVFAVVVYRTGRVVVPAILVFAGICFAVAAIGSALGKGRPK